jgi:hypothetical protein
MGGGGGVHWSDPLCVVVILDSRAQARGNVEDWLMTVQKMMIESLQKLMKQAVLDYDDQDRKDFVLTHKGQIVATTAQVGASLPSPTPLFLCTQTQTHHSEHAALSPTSGGATW